MVSQEKPAFHVLIYNTQDKDLFIFDKNEKNTFAKIKIIYHDKKGIGFADKKEIKTDEIVIVKSQPNSRYYEFKSVDSPVTINTLDKLKLFSIEDISRHKLWNNNYLHSIIFVEKVKKDSYRLWKMEPIHEE